MKNRLGLTKISCFTAKLTQKNKFMHKCKNLSKNATCKSYYDGAGGKKIFCLLINELILQRFKTKRLSVFTAIPAIATRSSRKLPSQKVWPFFPYTVNIIKSLRIS